MKRFYGRDGKNVLESAISDDDLGSQAASCSSSSANSDTSFGRITQNRHSAMAADEDEAAAAAGPSSFVLNEIEKYRKGEKHIFGSLGRLRKPRPKLDIDIGPSSRSAAVLKQRSEDQCDFQQELMLKVNRQGCGVLKVKATYV